MGGNHTHDFPAFAVKVKGREDPADLEADASCFFVDLPPKTSTAITESMYVTGTLIKSIASRSPPLGCRINTARSIGSAWK